MDEVKIRFLTENDLDEVRQFDDLSGNYVEQWLEDNEDYAWGLFKNGKLIGYCTIGYADDCGKIIENYPGWTTDSLLLSDVYIHPEYRHNGYATQMINEVIKRRTETEKELVFLTLLYDRLSELYKPLGFSLIGEGVMVRDERIKTLSRNKEPENSMIVKFDNGYSLKTNILEDAITDISELSYSLYDETGKAIDEGYSEIKNDFSLYDCDNEVEYVLKYCLPLDYSYLINLNYKSSPPLDEKINNIKRRNENNHHNEQREIKHDFEINR